MMSAMPKKLAVALHVYNGRLAIQEQVDAWATLSHLQTEVMEFLVADDCSSMPLELRSYGLPLRLFRITTDIPWNMAGAKNLLHAKSRAEWLLFFDVDNRADPALLAHLANQVDQLDANTIYMFPWILGGEEQEQPHINTFLIHRGTLDRMGGFDEDFCGHYGYEDVLFHHVAQRMGIARVLMRGIPFVAAIGATEGLSRDAVRNQALANAKASQPDYQVGPKLRFHWQEVPL